MHSIPVLVVGLWAMEWSPLSVGEWASTVHNHHPPVLLATRNGCCHRHSTVSNIDPHSSTQCTSPAIHLADSGALKYSNSPVHMWWSSSTAIRSLHHLH
jgi:hypothetical protein